MSLQGYHHFLHIHTTHLIHQKNGWSVGWLVDWIRRALEPKKCVSNGQINELPDYFGVNKARTVRERMTIGNELNLVCNLLKPGGIIQKPVIACKNMIQ